MARCRRIRRVIASLITGAALIAAGGAAQGQVSPGGWSNQLEWVDTVPVDTLHTEMVGTAFLFGKHLYLDDGVQGVNIYDVSDPLNPTLINKVKRPGPEFWPSEQAGAFILYGRPNTNGKILLLPGYDDESNDIPPPLNGIPWPGGPATWGLYVFDISDPNKVERLGKLTTYTLVTSGPFCILRCTWAYDRFGAIVDLRDPTKPKLAGKWTRGLRFNSSRKHKGSVASEIVEVAPGIVLTGTVPMYLLDVRKDPRRPRVLGRSDGSPSSRGTVAWPGFPNDNVILSSNLGGGAGYYSCDEADGFRGTPDQNSFSSWDATRWEETGLFTRSDDYFLKNGTYVDGDPPMGPPNTDRTPDGCVIRRFDVRRATDGGYLTAVAARAHGVKILHVGGDGEIETKGWFLGHEASSGNALWITRRIVYSFDHHRGIDILAYTGEL